jgi:DNA-binding HxlR family transcriptional regulator
MHGAFDLPIPSRQPSITAPIDELLTVKSGKWTMSVILHLRGQTQRFSELKRGIPGVSQKVLTMTLRTLERDGFVSRTSFATIPPRVDYALTELGNEVLRVFEAWEDFSHRHWTHVLASRQRFDESIGEEPQPVELTLNRASR